VTGYDLDDLARCELPTCAAAPAAAIAPLDLRPFVAAEHHAELDQLVADARAAVPLRDDNGALIAAWPMGLLRRAMLEAGHRLGWAPSDLAVEATVDELVGLLRGAAGPPAAELEDRRAERRRWSQVGAPSQLGPEFAIPPLEALPRPLALIGAAQLAAADSMLGEGGAVGVGVRAHVGRALVVDDPATALSLVEPGDVVVTRATSPTWNVVLAQAGAIVTTTGGLLSHAAVLARELGIPAVLGDVTAMGRFETGATVRVDPERASVTGEVPVTRGEDPDR
jgi:pyruvate,water dikinase